MNDDLQPFYALFIAMAFGIVAAIYVTSIDHRATFKQRWAPVESMGQWHPNTAPPPKPLHDLPNAIKGDRLPIAPHAYYNGPYRMYGQSRVI